MTNKNINSRLVVNKLKAQKILLVEDEVFLREVYGEHLTDEGAEVYQTADLNEAKVWITQMPFDVILTDLHLPTGSGFDLLATARQIYSAEKFPQFIISTGLVNFSLPWAYDQGVSAIFQKPFKLDSFMDVVFQSLMSPQERWPEEKEELLPSSDEVSLDLMVPLTAKNIHFGRGGFFIPLTPAQIPPLLFQGKKVLVKLREERANETIFCARGVCRFVISKKNHQENEGAAEGVGIEFTYLPPKSVLYWQNSLRQFPTYAFIPNTQGESRNAN